MTKTNEIIIEEKMNRYKTKKDINNGHVFATVDGKTEMHKLEKVLIHINDKEFELGKYLEQQHKVIRDLKEVLNLTTEKLIKIEKELKENGTITK